MLQKQIRAAENGDLQINIEPINSMEFINSTIGKISSHIIGIDKQIILDGNSADIDIETDKVLFQRIMINMLKNALESTPQKGSVITGIQIHDKKIRFWVKNDLVIPEDVQMQMFQRSFSTKGNGRGIGNYSIKLLTENYLKGKVSFISNKTAGTVFSIELNKKFPT
jgi:signal transduction histidine kinase